jgi:putative transcriptional regulator
VAAVADPTAPGTLLIAPPSHDPDVLFARTVVLLLDREPNGITSGVVLNRPLEGKSVVDSSALALLFISDPAAPAFWGGPMGHDPAILAELTATDGLEWFHLPKELPRPFPLPNVGVIAVAEHVEPFAGRILRARLFIGLCVWGRGQLQKELEQGAWRCRAATPAHIFTPQPEALWEELVECA